MARESAKRQPPIDWLTEAEVANLLGMKPNTLRAWRARGRGPKFTKPTGTKVVLYDRADIDDWLLGEKSVA